MIQYLIILLDDTCVPICHYSNNLKSKEPRLINYETLNMAIVWAMKENCMIQFVYPDYDLPIEYKQLISIVDHHNIISSRNTHVTPDVIVIDDWKELEKFKDQKNIPIQLRISKDALFEGYKDIGQFIPFLRILNITITDIPSFSEEDFAKYKEVLEHWAEIIKQIFVNGETFITNILTGRIFLDKMNNCGAGDSSITLAPDGQFYICPGFYFDKPNNLLSCSDGKIGTADCGLSIKNQRLYQLSYAPICRKCDAFQCKRCIWLNEQMTYEVNTPSRQQCIISHIERNAAKALLESIQVNYEFLPEVEIPTLNYIDPFETLNFI